MLNRITYVVLICILLELFLGGGGRLIAWGPVSLRMILFAIAIALTFAHLFQGARLDSFFTNLLILFSVMLAVGILLGVLNGANRSLLWEDVKPLLYFYLLPFFVFAINSRREIDQVTKLLQLAAISMAVVYLIILLVIHSGLLPFLDFYSVTYPTGEFFFRGEVAFFYKGFIYMCVGFVVIHFKSTHHKGWLMIVILLAIVLTLTRGFLLAISLTYCVYFALKFSYRNALVCVAISAMIIVGGGLLYSSASKTVSEFSGIPASRSSTTLLGDRNFSDNERKTQLKQVFASITPASVFVGHGFGNGVQSRPVHMEISYLEIFHKQGIVGLTCWAFLLVALIQSFQTASVIDANASLVFLLASLLIFFQSLTNQYINNPIGLSMILISLACLNVLKKEAA